MSNSWDSRISAGPVKVAATYTEMPQDGDNCYIVLLEKGSCDLSWEDDSCAINSGTVTLLGSTRRYSLRQAGRGEPEGLYCAFPNSLLYELRSIMQQDYTRIFAPLLDGRPAVLHGSLQWNTRMRTLLALTYSAAKEDDFPGSAYLLLLLHYIEQEYVAERLDKGGVRNETVERVCTYLSDNYHRKVSLPEVAAQFYLSPYYLSRLFRRVMGESIVDYVNARRIEAAQQLLEETDLSVTAVAEQTGFSTTAHFRRVFREKMQVGPAQYRKNRRKKKE